MSPRKLIQKVFALLVIVSMLAGMYQPVKAQPQPGWILWVGVDWGVKDPDRVKVGMSSNQQQEIGLNFTSHDGQTSFVPMIVGNDLVEITDLRDAVPASSTAVEILPENGGRIYTRWNSDVCDDGPQLTLGNENNVFGWYVVNTTGQTLYYWDHSRYMTSWVALNPSEGFGFRYGSAVGFVEFKMNPYGSNCADLKWDFSPQPAPMHLEIPENMGIIDGQILVAPVLVNNLQGQEGIQFAVEFDPEKLQYIGEEKHETIAAEVTSSVNLSGTQVLVAAVALGTFSKEQSSGNLIKLSFLAKGKYAETSDLRIVNLYTKPERNTTVRDGYATFGTLSVSGIVQDYWGQALPATQYVLQFQPGGTEQGPIQSNGTFELLMVLGKNSLMFYPDSIDESRLTLQDIQDILDASTDRVEVDFLSADTNKDGILNIDDAICNAKHWLDIADYTCSTGYYRYDGYEPIFDNFSPNLHGMKVVGRLVGDVIRTDVAAAATTAQPTVEFLEQRPAALRGGAIVTMRISGENLGALGFEFSHVVQTNSAHASSNENRLIALSDQAPTVQLVEVFVPTTEELNLSVDLYYQDEVIRNAATTTISKPELYTLLLPAVER